MLVKSCLSCRYHEITDECDEQTSHCKKENCYSRYTKCIAQKALTIFLKNESFAQNRGFSALTLLDRKE
jgi:hypothetical protein